MIVSLLAGCATKEGDELSETQVALLDSVRRMSPEKEFDGNLKSGNLVFYAYGGTHFDCYVSGLTAEEIAKYTESELVAVEIAFSAHPGPLGTSRQYWNEVSEFVSRYNMLVIEYLKKNGIPAKPAKKSAGS